MARPITVVLPVDADAPATRPLAAGLGTFAGACVGVVDNRLWRSMATLVASLGEEVGALGAAGIESTPFDHLADDFTEQQAALGPLAGRVRGAIAGLGN
ncbi:MAG TPA: hypothetical protein VGQ20_04230 [Acidimicrobiales bacterium]|jgi:hypothetical protein|nr:hypothetical protein [Acidimicrobiales bacterium]